MRQRDGCGPSGGLDDLNENQRDAVLADENILCCACPGSGKTSVIVRKVEHVLTCHPDPYIILTTFSRDAANEMLERIRAKVGAARMRRLSIGNFHSLALGQLKEAGVALRVLNQAEINHIILRALDESEEAIDFEEAENLIYTCKIDRAYAKQHPSADRLTKAYQAHLHAREACDFTDLLLRANDLMARGKLKPLHATHVMTDEFQDIDRLQFRWLEYHLGPERLACAVGDDDQSIYRFRRALGYHGMMEFVAMTDARIITLDVNYRSTAGILRAASRLIDHNLDRVKKQLRPARGQGPEPKVVRVQDTASQAECVVEALSEICAGNPIPAAPSSGKPYRFGVRKGQVAVLARTNSQLSYLEKVCIDLRIPYLRTGRALWDSTVAQVFASLLTSLHNRDSMGLEVALRWANVSDRLIRELAEGHQGNLWNMLAGPEPRVRVACGPEADCLKDLGRGWARKLTPGYSDSAADGVVYGVAGWMKAVMEGTCACEESRDEGARGKRNIQDLWMLPALRDIMDSLRGNLLGRLIMARREPEMRIPRVILSTFHSAKGLEWDHVFLLDVRAGSVPKVDDLASIEEIEEERRVFYVAMTRARDSLTIYTRRDREEFSEFLSDAGLLETKKQETMPVC